MLSFAFRLVRLPSASTKLPRSKFYGTATVMGVEVNTSERLAALRKLMAEQPVGAYIVPSEDQHFSEYPAECDERRGFISGFNGSAGTAIVTKDNAYLFTDGRYFLQAEQQLDKNWKLMKQGLPNVPTWQEFISKQIPKSERVGIDPGLISAVDAKSFSDVDFAYTEENLVDKVWGADRPARPTNVVFPLDVKYSGQSHADKLAKLREELHRKNAGAMVVTMLDEVAWLFNLRGSDIAFNPVFFAYAVVTVDKALLFIDPVQVNDTVKDHLGLHVELKPYTEFRSYLKGLAQSLKTASGTTPQVLLGDKASIAVAEAVGKDHVDITRSPAADLKAIKNPTEVAGFRASHVRDGAALARYFAWLEEQLDAGDVLNESQAADQLEKFRSELDLYKGLSFPTISSTGPNAAIIHYQPDPADCATVKKEQIYLCDSGAQFLDGTTDVTRTWHFGTPTDEEMRAFTRVLQGHIAIDTAIFPNGTSDYRFIDMTLSDTWARRALWQDGLDYRHGTGHGVGHFLNVHEGPQGIGTRIAYNSTALKPGMTVSNEPGYYADGRFGIRLENVVIVRDAQTPNNFGGKGYLNFERVTMCPLHKKLVDLSLLSVGEREWLDAYHKEVWEKVSPLLQNDAHPGHGVGSGPVNPDVATSKDDKNHSNPNLIVSNEDGIDFGVVERHGTPPVFPRQTAALTIETTDFHPEAKLVDLGFVSTREQSGRTTRFAASLHGESQWIEQGHPRTVTVIFIPLHEGSFAETLELTFRILDGPDIVISRSVMGIALPSAAAPAGSASGAALPSLPQIVPSNGPHAASNPHMPRASTRSQSLPRPQMWSRPPLSPDLKQTTKIPDGKHWQECLQVEETALQRDMVLRDVKIEPAHLRLYNVHFTEDEDDDFGIPDIKLGDYAILVDVLLGTESEGRIHTYETHNRTIRLQGGSSWAVMDVKLSLSMQDAFTLDRHANYDLRFKLNRMPLPCRLLFPTPTHVTARKISRDKHDIREMFLYNANIRNDGKQMQCVLSIIRQPAGSVPFIIYGPPGTGKTVTIVESIVQLLLKDANTRILACAQTNAAADLLVARLYKHLSKKKLFRLIEKGRNPDDIGTEHMHAVLVCSLLDEDGAFDHSGDTAGCRSPARHFSHIFIDDAAQATEPETMIPIRMMAGKRTNVVLAGDKEQLRPVVKGLESQLSVSYVERLMRIQEVYGLDSDIGTSGKTIVQLQTNRRSHPAIIAFSNTYIYEDSLTARADEATTTSFLRSPVLATANFPIVFEGVKGSVEKAKNYDSLYNEREAEVVRFHCQKLLRDAKLRVRPEEIGVITPYKAQVRQIKKSLTQAGGLDEVTVGSTEQFQSQERRVIIVSTVRSTDGGANGKSPGGYPDVVNVGFLNDRYRLNVVLTRAQALLIVIGDPTTLSEAGLWRHFLGTCDSTALKLSMNIYNALGRADTLHFLARFAASLHGESQWIEQGHTRTVTVTFIPLYEGSFAEILELTFRIINGSDIVISRPVMGIAGLPSAAAPADSASGAALLILPQIVPSDGPQATSYPLVPQTSPRNWRPRRQRTWSRRSHLPEFPLPPDLKETVQIRDDRQHEKAVRSIAKEILFRRLDIESYGQTWKQLLWVVETALQHELEHMVVRDVRVEASAAAHIRYKSVFSCFAVHFTENEDDGVGSPDIKFGDYVILIDNYSGTKSEGRIRAYEARDRIIHLQGGGSIVVMDISLTLNMQGAFILDCHANYDLRFKLNRMPLRRMHHAVTMDIPDDLCRLLFPTPTHVAVEAESRDEDDILEMVLYNADIRNDRKQMQCVHSITRQPAGSVPFIIYGPPGTGKTVTTVESILQLLLKDNTRVLACAQTNSAADLLVARLHKHLSKEDLFRLFALSRYPDGIAAELVDAVLERSLLDEDGFFDYSRDVAGCGVPARHFSHIFIDEAAQAMEPEAMIPIRMMADEQTNVVLAGDKEQLRPVVKGLDSQLLVSYIERLMRMRDVYGLDSEIGRSGQTIVQLQTNRRSHPAIIAFSNSYIYEDSLEARADPAITTSLLHSPVLEHANPSFPIVFEGVYGKAVKAKHSKSLYNEQEANIVRFYCQKLLGDNERPLRPEEIGVITPYRAQVKQIRKSLGEALDEVSVGSVEQFQGQERRVIIVSTVRSMRGNQTAGFIKDRNRLNVAITRAKALVIVIGDPIMLGKAGLWRHFLNYVHSHAGCLGEEFNWNPDNETDIVPAGYDRALREQPTTQTGPEFVERVDFESTVLRYIADPMLRRG
ncbi:hypothetical protein EWM64_g5781 [Hericium alpestre]|uniref:RNA helicase n=1 Tax=Hericium alpestre TaxID=135208 RepID=A0A4Y9ZWF4_9AGAM|nr:hypothetical protein EWM64_g5781 [Hericium alpestre]